MTLRMELEHLQGYGNENTSLIYVYCDWCGEWIWDCEDGAFCWRVHPVEGTCIDGTIHHVHIECSGGFVEANSGQWDWDWHWLRELTLNLATTLQPMQWLRQERIDRYRARGRRHVQIYPHAGEPGSAFQLVTQQESERWAQEHSTIQLKEGQVYEAAVLLRRMERAKQEMEETLGELLRQIETEPGVGSSGEDVETQEPDDQAAAD